MNRLFVGIGALVLSLLTLSAVADDLRDWGDQINDSTRFEVLAEFNGNAVLDKESQLVWELRAGDTNQDRQFDSADWVRWEEAVEACAGRVMGDRMGWRLPSVNELSSILVYNRVTDRMEPPASHPFIGIDGISSSDEFWSASTINVRVATRGGTQIQERAFVVNMVPVSSPNVFTQLKTNDAFVVWCVRSGSTGPHQY